MECRRRIGIGMSDAVRQGQTDPTDLELVKALAMGQLEISRKVVLNIFEWMGRPLIEETFHCGNGRKRAETGCQKLAIWSATGQRHRHQASCRCRS